ncbi:MAG: hypothetical protein KJ914_16360 [Gammaproteobacteria bacterium]|nr:hypothetical protein [Gammaproteobacteria bacterium]MBU1722687.1 hypothetical protein [Gammaproteobacteria bacterium]MBU2006011.1 hypothetical protein [Gammaproteobacteria bacterium]
MEKWINFYRPYIATESELQEFVTGCENLQPEDHNHRAKIMMHQGQRLLVIADSMEEISPGYTPLKLLFLLIAAENISKLHISRNENGSSKYHVKRFFNQFCSEEDKQKIINGIGISEETSTLDDVIDVLYDIRCDVVHEGTYWGFDFATSEHPSILTGVHVDRILRVKLHYQEFRDVVARAIICSIQQILTT